MIRVGFDLGASPLQGITLTPQHRGFADNEWIDLNINSNNPTPNLTLTLCTNY